MANCCFRKVSDVAGQRGCARKLLGDSGNISFAETSTDPGKGFDSNDLLKK